MTKRSISKENATTILVSLVFLIHAIAKGVFGALQITSGTVGSVVSVANGITITICGLIALWTFLSSPKQIYPLLLLRWYIPIMFIINNLRIIFYDRVNIELIIANLAICTIIELWASERIAWVRLLKKLEGKGNGK